MNRFFRLATSTLSLFLLAACHCLAYSDDGTVTARYARFTVVAASCVRMEYSPTGTFVDDPSYFAANRDARLPGVSVKRDGNRLEIASARIELTYIDDGRPFDAANLTVKSRQGDRWIVWTPDMKNEDNLGGAIRTLDGFDGAGPLADGILSRNGWYLLDDSRGVLIENGWAKDRPADAGTDWYLFIYGSNYRGALRGLTAVSGAVPLPRRYMLGAWYSRYWPYSSTEYRQIVDEYAEHDFPLDNIVMDMDWHNDGWTGWSWNRKLLPDAEALLAWFHQQGLHVTLNVHPSDGVAPHETQYAAFMRDLGLPSEGGAGGGGLDPSTGQTVPFDASNQLYMNALFKDVHQPLEQEGVDFWWLDWQQAPYTRGIRDLTNLAWLNELYWRETSRDGKRGASFSRWGGWGDQRHPIHFSGDASTHWPMLAFEVPMTVASGNSGCFFWTHDIGGHWGGRNEESYARWCQFGAMSAALRAHSARDKTMDRRPWMYPAWTTHSIRVSEQLRSVLFPYLYTSAAQSSGDSVPLLRPMYLDYPNVEDAYHNAQQYFLGDNLLVAPIAEPGVGPGRVARQTVWFPGGDWYDWFTGVLHGGRGDALVADAIDEFPLYARGGVPIPMQEYTTRMATTQLRTLIVRCYPGREGLTGKSSLYQDDGESTAYRSGAFATTSLSYTRQGDKSIVTIGGARGHYVGQPSMRGYVVEFPCLCRASHAWVDGKPASVDYEFPIIGAKGLGPALGIDRVTVAPRPIGRVVTVKLEALPLSRDDLRNHAAMRRIAGVIGDDWGHKTVAEVLADPRMAGLDSAQLSAVLACDGIGLVDHDESVYGYQGDHRLHLYTPSTDSAIHILAGPAADAPLSPLGMGDTRQVGYAQLTYPGPFTLRSSPLATEDNVALAADVTASSTQPGYSPQGAIDGIVDGYPGNTSAEWASDHEKSGAWIKLSWKSPRTIDRVVLYDRPNTSDQVLAGKLTFDDGSSVDVGALPDDASTGLEVKFPPKAVSSLTFTITSSKSTTVSTGISEIAVYRAH